MCQGTVLCHTLIPDTLTRLIPKISATSLMDKLDFFFRFNIKSSLLRKWDVLCSSLNPTLLVVV